LVQLVLLVMLLVPPHQLQRQPPPLHRIESKKENDVSLS
jgi:hypothetical protein